VKYGLLILALAAATGAIPVQSGGWTWLLAWPVLSGVVVGVAYLAGRPGVFGKTAAGRLPPFNLLLLAPYFAATYLVWHAQRKLTSESASDEVAPGIYVGRRPYFAELPEGTSVVVDLTAEFPVDPQIVREGIRWLCLPTLDGTAPDGDGLKELLDDVEAADEAAGPIYIHCAAGHGRSATAAAALMIRRGLAADVDSAEAAMRAKRPGIHLNRAQRARLNALELPSP
jgi:protein-tyrosine phosphatase